MFDGSFITGIVISFLIRQLKKFQASINWTLIKADVGTYVAKVVPGEWLDDEAKLIAFAVIDRAAYVLSQTGQLERILKLAADSKPAEAFSAFVDLLLDGWMAQGDADVRALALVEGCRATKAAA